MATESHRSLFPEIREKYFLYSKKFAKSLQKRYFWKISSELCISRYWIVIVFRPKDMRFFAAGIEIIREHWLLQIKNNNFCGLDFNWHHKLRFASNFSCHRYTMLTVKWNIALLASQIWASCYSSWKASLFRKCQ